MTDVSGQAFVFTGMHGAKGMMTEPCFSISAAVCCPRGQLVIVGSTLDDMDAWRDVMLTCVDMDAATYDARLSMPYRSEARLGRRIRSHRTSPVSNRSSKNSV